MVPFKPMTEEKTLELATKLHVVSTEIHFLRMTLRSSLSTEMKFRLDEINEAYDQERYK